MPDEPSQPRPASTPPAATPAAATPAAGIRADQTLRPIDHRPGPWIQIVNPAGFEWNRYDLPLPNLPAALEGLRIVHLTDVHLRPAWHSAYDTLIARLRDDPPDLILLSGDLLESRYDLRPSLPIVERFLRGLSSRLGTWIVMGNHDTDLPAAHFERFGARAIDNRFVRLSDGDASIELIGLLGVERSDSRGGFMKRLPPRAAGAVRIVMSHFPDSIVDFLASEAPPDLLLAGHTHGGQCCLPGGRPIIRHTKLPVAMTSGVHRVGSTWLVIGRGLGFATWQFRLFCPAEVIEMRLRNI